MEVSVLAAPAVVAATLGSALLGSDLDTLVASSQFQPLCNRPFVEYIRYPIIGDGRCLMRCISAARNGVTDGNQVTESSLVAVNKVREDVAYFLTHNLHLKPNEVFSTLRDSMASCLCPPFIQNKILITYPNVEQRFLSIAEYISYIPKDHEGVVVMLPNVEIGIGFALATLFNVVIVVHRSLADGSFEAHSVYEPSTASADTITMPDGYTTFQGNAQQGEVCVLHCGHGDLVAGGNHFDLLLPSVLTASSVAQEDISTTRPLLSVGAHVKLVLYNKVNHPDLLSCDIHGKILQQVSRSKFVVQWFCLHENAYPKYTYEANSIYALRRIEYDEGNELW